MWANNNENCCDQMYTYNMHINICELSNVNIFLDGICDIYQ